MWWKISNFCIVFSLFTFGQWARDTRVYAKSQLEATTTSIDSSGSSLQQQSTESKCLMEGIPVCATNGRDCKLFLNDCWLTETNKRTTVNQFDIGRLYEKVSLNNCQVECKNKQIAGDCFAIEMPNSISNSPLKILQSRSTLTGIDVKRNRKSNRRRPIPCPRVFNPVCAIFKGVKSTFDNECLVNAENIHTGKDWRIFSQGLCAEDFPKHYFTTVKSERFNRNVPASRTQNTGRSFHGETVIYAPPVFHTEYIRDGVGNAEKFQKYQKLFVQKLEQPYESQEDTTPQYPSSTSAHNYNTASQIKFPLPDPAYSSYSSATSSAPANSQYFPFPEGGNEKPESSYYGHYDNSYPQHLSHQKDVISTFSQEPKFLPEVQFDYLGSQNAVQKTEPAPVFRHDTIGNSFNPNLFYNLDNQTPQTQSVLASIVNNNQNFPPSTAANQFSTAAYASQVSNSYYNPITTPQSSLNNETPLTQPPSSYVPTTYNPTTSYVNNNTTNYYPQQTALPQQQVPYPVPNVNSAAYYSVQSPTAPSTQLQYEIPYPNYNQAITPKPTKAVYNPNLNDGKISECILGAQPVCGVCNDKTRNFQNVCELLMRNIFLNQTWTILHAGKCSNCTLNCNADIYNPVCVTRNGINYTLANDCFLRFSMCQGNGETWKILHKGECQSSKPIIEDKYVNEAPGFKYTSDFLNRPTAATTVVPPTATTAASNENGGFLRASFKLKISPKSGSFTKRKYFKRSKLSTNMPTDLTAIYGTQPHSLIERLAQTKLRLKTLAKLKAEVEANEKA